MVGDRADLQRLDGTHFDILGARQAQIAPLTVEWFGSTLDVTPR